MARPITLRHLSVHGHKVGYRMGGSGPAVVLIHGLTGSSSTWREVMPVLAERYTVIAPDLLGHGESAKPRGDYSLGAFASGIRDLLVGLGIERATVVGHSLGGGVAMQLAYQFPQRCERLVLVSSGGLGKEVSWFLKLVSLPGSELVMPLFLLPHMKDALERVALALGNLPGVRTGSELSSYSKEVWRSYAGLTETQNRMAFIHTVRSVIDPLGQRVSARDRLYLAQKVPTLIVWGDRDKVIPVEHAYAAHDLIPGSHLAVVEGVGHFVPIERPGAFIEAFDHFMASTEPSHVTEEEFRVLLQERAAELEYLPAPTPGAAGTTSPTDGDTGDAPEEAAAG